MDFFLRTSATGTFRSFRSAGNYGIFNTINALSSTICTSVVYLQIKIKNRQITVTVPRIIHDGVETMGDSQDSAV